MPIERLSSSSHWEAINRRIPPTAPQSRLKRFLHIIFGSQLIDNYTRSFTEHKFWNTVLATHLPHGGRAIEIGSAPGDNLARLKLQFDCEPFGIEYTEEGVKANRETFKSIGVPMENVIHADFFDDAFLERHRGAYDVVLSCGFIEHFDNPREVVDRHLALLKPGGTLIISIPRLVGINYLLAKLFAPDMLPIHNLRIMRRRAFLGLFDPASVDRLFAGYCGVVNVSIVTSHGASRWCRAINRCQPALNFLLRIFPFRPESSLFSPVLLFVGRKRCTRAEEVR
jgi:SAM-dependent methyltransferase